MHEDGIGMARTFELEFTGQVDVADGRAARVLRVGRRRPGRGLPRPAAGGPARLGHAAAVARRAPIGILTGPLGAQVLDPLVGALGRDDVRVITVANDFFGGNIGVTGLMVGEDLARVLADAARGPPLPAARRLPVAGPVPRRRWPPRTCPARSRSSPPTASPSGPPSIQPAPADQLSIRPEPSDEPAHRRHRRTSQRRQVDPPQPHRRPSRRHRRGEARRHARPQGGRGRVAGLPVPAGRHRRLAARWRRARRQGQPPERAGHQRCRRRSCSSSTRSSGSPRRTAGSPTCSAGSTRPSWWSPTRSTTPTARPRRGSSCRLGLGEPFPVSALHGRGTGDLLDALVARPARARGRPERSLVVDDPDKIFSVALVGRPNVGKSTLFNRLIGDERAVVHDMPGTTRDAIDTVVETPDGPVRFVDTAGMRRKAKIDENTEYYSFVRALQVDRQRRRRAARDRRHRRHHPPGPAPGRAHRRGRLSRWWCC